MRKGKKFLAGIVIVFFVFCNMAYGADQKESSKEYLRQLDIALREINVIYINAVQKVLSVSEGAKNMHVYINNIKALTPPGPLAKHHKMIVLAVEKLRMGFDLLAKGDRPAAIAMVRRSADLLRIAVKNVMDYGKKEGLITKNDQNNQNKQKEGGVK